MTNNILKCKNRIIEQHRNHYEIEKELANRLRNASRQERKYLYQLVYDEMYKQVQPHEQLNQNNSSKYKVQAVSAQFKIIKPFMYKDTIFLEVGSGDCSLSLEVAKYVKQVYSVEVSNEITKNLTPPPNFNLILSDGNSIPVPSNSISVAYSSHLMEHLHPDDAFEQLENICHALAPGGTYVCITPNRLSGPHDVSKYFDKVATCFHLKEYTYCELSSLFKKIGFSRVKVLIGARGKYILIPTFISAKYETLLGALPYALRKTILKILPFRLLLGIGIVGIK